MKLEFLPRGLAPAGSLAGRLLAGEGPVELPLPGDPPARREGRLPAAAFGVTGDGVRDRLERVLAGEGYVVTTGQQPNLFLGPLFVLYKAVTAIELAERLERDLGLPVVPVFWIASDDHDWQEIGRTRLLDDDDELHVLELDPPAGWEDRPAGAAPLPEAILARVSDLSQLVFQSEFTDSYLELIRDEYRVDGTLAGAFARTLAGVLEGHDFAWLDAQDPAVKEAASPLFIEILRDPEPVIAGLNAGARELSAAGFEPPIHRLEGGLPLFHDDGTGRRRLVREDDGRLSAGRDPEPAEAWLERLAGEPGRFSPNVSGRPVLESWLLPVHTTVLGPGELSYWSQLPGLFDALDVPYPSLQPRAAWIVVEGRIRRVLDRLDLDVAELEDGGGEAVARFARSARPPRTEAAIEELRAAIGQALSEVDAAVREEVPGLKAAVGKTRKALFDAVTELGRLVDADTKRREEIQVERVHRAAAQLFPGGGIQERTLSPFHYLCRYGPDFVRELGTVTADWLSGGLAAPARQG